MFTGGTSVGLDVHARSVAAAAIDGVTGELVQAKPTPSHEHIRAWLLDDLPGPVAVTYEAGPTGFGLSRLLNAAGIRCVVVAPSKLQRPVGDRVKTDAKDAVHLARLLRLDEITAVTVPTVVEQKAARDLVRAREDARGDLMRARHRLSKLSRVTVKAHHNGALNPKAQYGGSRTREEVLADVMIWCAPDAHDVLAHRRRGGRARPGERPASSITGGQRAGQDPHIGT